MKRIKLLFSLLGLFAAIGLSAQNALDFDGTDDKVNCGTSTAFNVGGTSFSLEAWILAHSWPSSIFQGSIILKENNSNNGGYMLRAGSNGNLGFGMGAGTNGSWTEINTSGLGMDTGKWYHVAATYDGSMMRVYLNGNQVDSNSTTISVGTSTSTPLTIGYHPSYGRYWDGKIDEVRVWNVTLTQAQIKAHKDAEFCSAQSGLRAYYKFNQGSAGGSNGNVTSLTDYSGYGNNATLSNFALYGSTSNWVSGATLTRDSTVQYDTITHCGGYFEPLSNNVVSKSGDYVYPTKTQMGCDSIIKKHVTILPLSYSSITIAVCDSFVGPAGQAYYTTGTYQDKIPNHAGCDSTITIHLTVGVDTGHVDTTVCYSYKSPSGKTLTSSGLSYDVLTNASSIGCDSVVAIQLYVLGSSTFSIHLEYCDSVKSPSGKYWYSSPGTYADTLISSLGCDSILSIQVNGKKSFSTLTHAQCDPWMSPSGKWLDTTGTYLDTLLNHKFCDSIITIDFTRYYADSSTLKLFDCHQVTSANGKDVFTRSGTYQTTLVNQHGCDSVVTMEVTIPQLNNGVQNNGSELSAVATGVGYQWLNCSGNMSVVSGAQSMTFVPSTHGYYAVEVSDRGCKDTSKCVFFQGTGLTPIESNGLRLSYLDGFGNFQLHSDAQLNQVKLEVYDMNGRLVYSTFKKEMTEMNLHLELNPGNYLLRINHSEGNWNSLLQIH